MSIKKQPLINQFRDTFLPKLYLRFIVRKFVLASWTAHVKQYINLLIGPKSSTSRPSLPYLSLIFFYFRPIHVEDIIQGKIKEKMNNDKKPKIIERYRKLPVVKIYFLYYVYYSLQNNHKKGHKHTNIHIIHNTKSEPQLDKTQDY